MQDSPGNPQGPETEAAEGPPRDPSVSAAVPGRDRGAWAAIIIFAAALLLRAGYLYGVRSIPFFEHPAVDAEAFDSWAQRIAAGEWWGGEVFYQAPGYPYFLGVLYSVAGRDLVFVRIVQIILGALSCAWVCAVGRRLFGPGAGWTAGLGLALYPPAIFFDGLIQKAGWGLFLTVVFLYGLVRAQQRPRAVTLALCGAMLGLLALTHEHALVWVPLVFVWVLLRFGDAPWARRTLWDAAFLAGVGVVLLPVGVRNYVVGRTFVLTASNLGTNFYIGNNPQADGLYAPLVPGRAGPTYERADAMELAQRALGRDLTAGEVSGYWFGEGWRFVREQPGTWLRLLLRKWTLVWNHFEVPDAEDMEVYGDWSPLLRTLGWVLHFGVLVPLAAAGMVLSWSRRRDLWILYLLVLGAAGSIALFFVFARYRFPLVPLLMLFAGAAGVEGYRGWRSGRQRAVAVATVVAAVLAGWCNCAVLPETELRSISYSNLGAICAKNGQPQEAERYLEIALRLYSDSEPAHRVLGHLRAEQGRAAEAHLHLGLAAGLRYDLQAALGHYRQAIAAAPNLLQAQYNLGTVLAHLGRYEEAATQMERCLERVGPAGPPELIARFRDRLARYRAQAPAAAPTPP